MQELKFEELSVKQKLGMVYAPLLSKGTSPEIRAYIFEQIRVLEP